MPKSKTETDQLSQYQRASREGKSLPPQIYFFDDRVEYYQAIIIDKGTCLLCLGDPDRQIDTETLEKIKAS